jgi:uncharacterized protein YdeI (YjbR/CyaY-like superfamily)
LGVSPIDVTGAIPTDTAADLDGWLKRHGGSEPEVVVAIYKASAGKQTVTLVELQEVALCHGWVDTQTKRIDDERYAIRFVPRRPGSTWGEKNRAMARRMLDQGRVRASAMTTLPPDL